MVKAIFLITILSIIIVSLPVQPAFASQEADTTTYNINIDLPEVNVLPGDFLYLAKSAWESIKSWFVVGKLNQAIYDLDLSNKRLTEIEYLIKQGKIDEAKELLEKYQKSVNRVEKNLKKIKGSEDKFNDLKKKADYYIYYHRDLFANIKSQLPADKTQSIDEINTVIIDVYTKLIDSIRKTEEQ